MGRVSILSMLVLLASCAPLKTRSARYSLIQPAGPIPDVLIIGVSGHCPPPCRAPRDNYDYLTHRGTIDLLADVIALRGFSVQYATYAGSATEKYRSKKVTNLQRGYAALLKDFNQIEKWFDQPKPPKLILVGHSHGSTWLHHFVRTHPHIPIEVQIDIDSICAAWKLDHQKAVLKAKIDVLGQPSAVQACEPIKIKSKKYESKDLVFPNVKHNLEVQSKRLPKPVSKAKGRYFNYLFDTVDNVRLDGSKHNIQTFLALREDHGAVTRPLSDSMNWIRARLAKIVKQWHTDKTSKIPAIQKSVYG